MIEINGKQFCENCFEPITGDVCPACGYDPADSAHDPLTLAPGSILMNRYVVGRVIGKGGFGITYLAYDALTRKKIALKEYFPYGLAQRTSESIEVSVTSDDNVETFKLGAEKFYNEAKLVSRFNGNPNIVGVYDCFYENDTVYMAMEYLRGSTLKDHIREHGILSAPQALFVADSITNALVVAHSASVLHRDISPDNVMLCDNGDIKLIDFGAARQLVAERSQAFSVILKPGFAPPEQYSKKGNQGSWTDVYSLGATLYFMLTGDIPEDPTSRFDDDDTFKENQFEIDPTLWGVITKATKLKIEDRYADAYELKKALERVPIKPEPPIAPDVTPAEDTPSEFAGSAASLKVSIVKPRPKQSFFRKHLRTLIEATCGLLAVALIIPLAIKAFAPNGDPAENISSVGGSSDGNSTTDGGNTDSVIRGDTSETFEDIGFDKPFYSEMDDDEKRLYEMLYYCVKEGKETVAIPTRKYTIEQVPSVYYRMMYDNPEICDVQDFRYSYTDINNNSSPEPDEYVSKVSPYYIDVDPQKMYDKAKTFLDGLDKSDKIECLRQAHDWLISEAEITERYDTATCTYSYGAIIDRLADDLGFARAFCYLAQELGFYSFVIDEKFNGEQRAWVRVKIDGSWYNVDVYGDKTAGESVTKIPLGEGGGIFHTYFLAGDEFLFNNGYESAKTEGSLWIGDNGLPSPNENYYFSKIGQDYRSDTDAAYNMILQDAARLAENGGESASYYAAPFIADELYEKMNGSFLSDLKSKYGVIFSGFTAEYDPDCLVVTLKK